MPIAGVSPRLLEIGRIRMGEKGSKGEPVKLDHWRLTSSHAESLNAAAKLYGGVVGEWQGGYELVTETDVLEVLVPPNAFTSYLEAWTKGGIQRRCDGLSELVTGAECICSAEGNQVCEPASNLRLLLPQLPGIGSWRLATKGWIAAAELQGTVELLGKMAHVGEWPAAELFLDHRSKVVAGQTRRFVVPVLRLPYSLAELSASETRALGSGAIVRVDTHTGEINPSELESLSRETSPGTTRVAPTVSSPGDDTSASEQGKADADGRDGVDTASSVPPASSSAGTTEAPGAQGPSKTSDPADDPKSPAQDRSAAQRPTGGGSSRRRSAPSKDPVGDSPPPAGDTTWPNAPKDCLHVVGLVRLTDGSEVCKGCGTPAAKLGVSV